MTDQLSSDLASLRIDRQQAPHHGGSWRWVVPLVLAFGGVGAAVWYALPRVRASLDRPEVELTEVSMISPTQASVLLSATGYVVPQTLVKVSSRSTARIEQVLIKEGDKVERGQSLFHLETGSRKTGVKTATARTNAAHARAATARANLAELEQQLRRQRRLADSGAVGPATVEDLEARVRVLRAQVTSADAEAAAVASEKQSLAIELGEMGIVSPISGRVISRPLAAGDLASPEKTLVELADFETMNVEVDVAETKLELIKQDMPCEVVLDAFPSRHLSGKVVEVNPRINRAKATGTVKVRFLDGLDIVLPDMAARVSFLSQPLQPAEAAAAKVVIPSTAVVDRNGRKVAFTLENGRARALPVSLGPASGGGFEVKEGPGAGTRVIRSPPATLVDGQAVKERIPQ